jgi:hypothetical protein
LVAKFLDIISIFDFLSMGNGDNKQQSENYRFSKLNICPSIYTICKHAKGKQGKIVVVSLGKER